MAALKVGELRSLLDKFADVLEKNKADYSAVRNLRELSTMFSGSEHKTVTTFLKATKQISLNSDVTGGSPVASVMPVLSNLRTFVSEVAKKDLNSSLDSLLDMLQARADSSISAFATSVASASKATVSALKSGKKKVATTMDDRLVDDYVRQLEAALGDDTKFETLLAELSADERVQQAEAVAIASRFHGRTAKSTSRPKALERIRERQDKLMKFKRQSSTAGRPAA